MDSILDELGLFSKTKSVNSETKGRIVNAYLTPDLQKDYDYITGKVPHNEKYALIEQLVILATNATRFFTKKMLYEIPSKFNPTGSHLTRGNGNSISYCITPLREERFYHFKYLLEERTGQELSCAVCLLALVSIMAKYFRHEEGIRGNGPQAYEQKTPKGEQIKQRRLYGRAHYLKTRKLRGGPKPYRYDINVRLRHELVACEEIGYHIGIDPRINRNLTKNLRAILRIMKENGLPVKEEYVLSKNKRLPYNNSPRVARLRCYREHANIVESIEKKIKEEFGIQVTHQECVRIAVLCVRDLIKDGNKSMPLYKENVNYLLEPEYYTWLESQRIVSQEQTQESR